MLKWLQVHAERAGWSPAEIARASAEKGQALPCVEFVAEAEQCTVCGSPLEIQKSRERQVATLEAGVFTAREVVKHCALKRPRIRCWARRHCPAGSGLDSVTAIMSSFMSGWLVT